MTKLVLNVIPVSVRGYDVLVIGKRLLRKFLRQAVRFFGCDVILRVKAVLEELHVKHADYIRVSLEVFKNKGELPDDEFDQICVSFKKELKARTDYVIEQMRNKT